MGTITAIIIAFLSIVTDPNGKSIVTDPNGKISATTTTSIVTDPNGKP
ncbi:MAG TPA: hypothetical protein PK431_14210 [Chitinophagales bacterium]|nr:hypothetical protein [Chitinophagales bacterium]